MDPDDAVIVALGALLTQLRSARRALEDVQRSTSRYGGFEFSNAFSQGDRFGAPPLFDGALMVHIVNINDLAPGNSFGGFLESLFGGIGNFFSNLIGGLVGSTVSAFKLPAMIEHLDSIVGTIERILIRIGVGGKKDPESKAEAQAGTGESLLTTLEGIRQLVKDVTALFEVGAGKGSRNSAEKAAQTSNKPITETGERWMAILNGVNVFLTRTQRLVDGLILLIPMAIGGIAFLIANLGEVRRAILETIQFLLRNALVLRGVLLTVVFETVASAARLAATVAGIIGDTIKSVLSAIFAIIQKLLEAAFAALESLTDALQAIVKSVLTWLVEGLFTTLRAIGELKLFQTVDRLIRVLPALLSAIYMLKSSKKLPDEIQGMLDTAHKAAFTDDKSAPGTGGKAPAPKDDVVTVVGNFPDLSKIFKPLGGSISGAISSTGATVAADVQVSFDNISTTLANVATRFDTAARNEAKFSSEVLDKYGTQIKSNADNLTKAITAPIEANAPSTGFELIAKTYEEWLTKGGLKSVLDGAKDYFKNSPKEAGEATGALRLLRGQFDRPRASIEIDEVEIILEPGDKPLRLTLPPPSEYGPGDFPVRTDEDVWLAFNRFDRQLTDRGIRPDQRDALVA